jgi:hypothetical protein
MGLYVKMLAHYLRFDLAELVRSVRSENIQIEPDASQIFLGA